MSDNAPLPFTLGDPEFVALAAGRPSAGTLATLKRSQLSRHLLLIREIAGAAPGPEYAALADAERADPAAVRARLADPFVGLWAAGCLSALRRGEPPPAAGVGQLAVLAHPPAGDGQASSAGGSQLLRAQHTAAGASRLLRAEHAGLTIQVRLEDTDPLRGRLGLTPAGRLSGPDLTRWRDLFGQAWRLLVTRHRPAAEILAAVLTVIVPVEPDPAARGISATSAEAFGAAALSEPADATALAVALVHETQHSLLNALQHLFDLHDRPGDLGYSPWRDDPRPAAGILHGAYAYQAVTRFWRAELHAGADHQPEVPSGAEPALAAFEFVRWRGAVAAAARRLLAAGGLTAAGERFTGALLAEVSPWLSEPIPNEIRAGDVGEATLDGRGGAADVVRLAEGANRDHYLRWRLRNLVVEPADVRALAEAWRAGLPPPGGAVRSRVVAAPERALESSARLELAHSWVGGEQPGGRASAADVAYLRGDGGTAADAYESMILIGSWDPAVWAGMALVSGWERVEVVAAVRRELGSEVVDVAALARWLAA